MSLVRHPKPFEREGFRVIQQLFQLLLFAGNEPVTRPLQTTQPTFLGGTAPAALFSVPLQRSHRPQRLDSEPWATPMLHFPTISRANTSAPSRMATATTGKPVSPQTSRWRPEGQIRLMSGDALT